MVYSPGSSFRRLHGGADAATSTVAMTFTALLGALAGTVTVVSFIPQVIRVWRTRRTRDLSMGAFLMLGTGAVLWFSYGLLTGDPAVIGTNLIVGLLVSAILVAKLRFG
jgi:MtN3 and saliva related transmembrane protein